jgi:hypothetical protein
MILLTFRTTPRLLSDIFQMTYMEHVYSLYFDLFDFKVIVFVVELFCSIFVKNNDTIIKILELPKALNKIF